MPQYTRIWWTCGKFIILICKIGATVNERHCKSNDPENENNNLEL